jgi:hypothetical protein
VSLMICAATAILWATSYRRDVVVIRVEWPRSYLGFRCIGGRALVWWVAQPMTDRTEGWHWFAAPATDAQTAGAELYSQFSKPGAIQVAGFGFTNARGTAADGLPYRDRSLIVPVWSVAGTTALLPAYWLAAWLKNRMRSRQGHCPTCAYNLTGNTSGVCPECGTAVTGNSGT